MQWPFDLILAPSRSGGLYVEADRYASGRRWHLSTEAAVDLALASEEPARWRESFSELASVGSEAKYPTSDLEHWRERGWSPSERHYIAASEAKFVDDRDKDGDARRHALDAMTRSEETIPEHDLDHVVETVGLQVDDPSPDEVVAMLKTRRSGRSFVRRPIPQSLLLDSLRSSLHAVRENRFSTCMGEPLSFVEHSFGSAWDIYVLIYNVDGLVPGVYQYDIVNESIELQDEWNESAKLRSYACDMLQGQRPPMSAGFTVLLVADFSRYQWRYRHEQGLRSLYIESGIIGQGILLELWRRGVATLVTPAQKDSMAADVLKLNRTQNAVVTTLTCGWSRGAKGAFLEG